jgi:hypothetical protein
MPSGVAIDEAQTNEGATALPDSVDLPRVASRANVGSPPKVHATTGASGANAGTERNRDGAA